MLIPVMAALLVLLILASALLLVLKEHSAIKQRKNLSAPQDPARSEQTSFSFDQEPSRLKDGTSNIGRNAEIAIDGELIDVEPLDFSGMPGAIHMDFPEEKTTSSIEKGDNGTLNTVPSTSEESGKSGSHEASEETGTPESAEEKGGVS